MAAQFKFLKGNYSGLNSVAITEGQLLITKDTRELFVDVDASTRIKIGDFTNIDTLAALEALDATAVPTSRLYYVVDTNIFCKSDGAKWVQINKDTGATSIEVVGDGNAVTAASYDATTRKLTLTMGETFALPADITNAVGELGNDAEGNAYANVKAYVDAKTTGIATDATVAGKVDKEEGKSLVDDDEITKLAGVSEGANKVEASATNGNIKIDGVETVVYTHPEKHAIADVTGLQDALDAKVAQTAYDADKATFATKTELGNVDAKFANYNTTEAQKAIDDAQDARIKTIEDDYLVEADIANFETKENVKKVADDLAAYVESNDAALALKADKSVVDAMYTNAKIDELVQGAKDYADANDADTKYGITYDSENKKIKLVEGGSEVEIDATDFIKDGMIETVTIGDDNDLIITFNTAAGKENIVLPLDQLVDIYTGVEGARVKVTVASDKSISADLVAGSISKNYLDSDVQASLAKADSALQEHQDISHLATTEALNGVDAKFTNYTTTTDLNTALDLKADKTQVATDIATAKGEAIADAKTETENQVKALADGAVATNASNIAANAEAIATKANAADVYAKTETYTQDEVDAAIEAAVTAATEWGSF